MLRTRIPDDKLQAAIREREEKGTPVSHLARRLCLEGVEISASALAWQFLRLNVLPPRDKLPRLHLKHKGPMVFMRGNFQVRRFSEEDDRILLEEAARGASTLVLAKRLGRAPNTIIGRLATLARYDEVAALKRGD